MTSHMLDYMIGFDKKFSSYAGNTENFPPYNFYERKTENGSVKTIIEFALAGYSKKNLSVIVDKNILRVSGKKEDRNDLSDRDYKHRGIALRSFEKQFALSEYAVVESSEFIDGVLRITVGMVIPEEKKPKVISIT